MPQSLARIWIHLVFSTKKRHPFLKDVDIREDLHRYLANCLKTLHSPALIINGTEDHVHLLFNLSRNHAVKTIVGEIKADSSKWIKKLDPTLRDFAWQRGYGAFSVSQSNLEKVQAYIRDQEQHHKGMTFQEEFRRICAQHGVELDERYAWD